MSDAAEIINAIANLFASVNEKTALIIVLIIVVTIIIKNFLDSKKQRYYFDQMVKEKNKEIERLADDNRRYREIYLQQIGMDEAGLKSISANNVKHKK